MSGVPRFKASGPKKVPKHTAKPRPEQDLDVRINCEKLQNFLKNKRRDKENSKVRVRSSKAK